MRVAKLLDARESQFQRLENRCLEAWVVADKLVDSGADGDCVLLVDEDIEMLLRGEQSEN